MRDGNTESGNEGNTSELPREAQLAAAMRDEAPPCFLKKATAQGVVYPRNISPENNIFICTNPSVVPDELNDLFDPPNTQQRHLKLVANNDG